MVIVGGKNIAEMHGVGPGPAGGGMAIAHPATMNGGADIGTGVPMIFTLAFGVVGLAMPPWGQVTTQLMVIRYPGTM